MSDLRKESDRSKIRKLEETHMWCTQKVFMLQARNSSLFVSGIEGLKFLGGEVLNRRLNSVDNLIVCCQVWSERFQANHFESCGSLERAMNVIILSRGLCLVQVCRHASIRIGLSLQQIRV